jgi:flagellar biosynthetic protein FliR
MALLATTLLVFARLGGLMFTMPVLSMTGIPKHLPVFLSMVLAILVVPHVPLANPDLTLGLMALSMAGEMIVGILMGSVVGAIFGAISMAADIMAMQMGFAMAMLFNPLQKTQQGAIAGLAAWCGGLVFLGSGLHLICIGVLVDSFAVVPPGQVSDLLAGSHVLMDAVAESIKLAMKLAGPVLILVWVVNVFVAVLVKLAPKMNIYFSVGMIMVNVAGMALFGVALPYILTVHEDALLDATSKMALIVGGF